MKNENLLEQYEKALLSNNLKDLDNFFKKYKSKYQKGMIDKMNRLGTLFTHAQLNYNKKLQIDFQYKEKEERKIIWNIKLIAPNGNYLSASIGLFLKHDKYTYETYSNTWEDAKGYQHLSDIQKDIEKFAEENNLEWKNGIKFVGVIINYSEDYHEFKYLGNNY